MIQTRQTESTRGVMISYHERLSFSSGRSTDFQDITERVRHLAQRSGVDHGVLHLQSLHTTVSIVLNEHEPLLLADLEEVLDELAPEAHLYQHDDLSRRTVNLTPDERRNGHSHARSLLLGANAGINIVHGQLQLGRWQRVFAVDLDGPRDRELSALVMGAQHAQR